MTNDRSVQWTCLATLVLAVSLVVGCGPNGPVTEKVNKANLDKIQLEMKLADVEALLGPGEVSQPGPSAKPEDSKLTWKQWKHSSRGSSVIIGFDSTNAAAVIDKNIAQ
ncbi:MAG: hypothetical protein K8R36_15195 [Planctomycetales bacterium]|nr:hypothetical protein [Planctomycetales bacterium]